MKQLALLWSWLHACSVYTKIMCITGLLSMPNIYAQDQEKQFADEVFSKLLAVSDRPFMSPPNLEISENTMRVASMKNTTVVIERSAIKICLKMGERSADALAAILSHELIHYYLEHDTYPSYFAGTDSDSRSGEVESGTYQQEEDADKLGYEMAFKAGYDAIGIASELLEDIYRLYNLPSEQGGRPNLSKRQEMALAAGKKALTRIYLFETATFLSLTQSYEQAARYFEYLLKEFQTQELFNQTAVNHILQAINLMPKEESQFIYPVEFDGENRLKRPRSPDNDQVTEHLNAAESFLIKANFQNAKYIPTLINLACLYDLMGKSELALLRASEALLIAKESTGTKILGDVYSILGIIKVSLGDTLSAKENFSKAIELGASSINLQLLKRPYKEPKYWEPPLSLEETIEKISLSKFDPSIEYDVEVEISSIRPTLFFLYKNTEQSVILSAQKIESQVSSHYYMFHPTPADYEETTSLGIRIGDSKKELMTAYKKYEHREFQHSRGHYLVFDYIIFSLDKNKNVKNWCVRYVK